LSFLSVSENLLPRYFYFAHIILIFFLLPNKNLAIFSSAAENTGLVEPLPAPIFAAKFLGCDTAYGTIAPNKKADFIVLSNNPENNILNTRKIEAVWKNGIENE
jgi:hypothetical protein